MCHVPGFTNSSIVRTNPEATMKKCNLPFQSIVAMIAGLILGAGSLSVKGALVIDRFDDATTVDFWSATWGTTPELTWDALDAGASATSGSLRISADYFTPADNGWEQMVITKTFDPPVVGSEYVSVSVDVKVDSSSVPTAAGQYGYFELKRPDGTAMGGVNLTSTNWTTITFNIAPTEATLNSIIIQNGNGGFQGPIIYYLDNFVFTQAAGGAAPPTVAITKNASPGLKLYASAPGQAYQRQNIVFVPSEDLANLLWWVNQPDSMTYSVTWADFPNKNDYAGFQGHIMLVSDSGGGITPDWNDANAIMIEFQYVNDAGADGTNGTSDDQVLAQARFLHKVNEAAGNGMLYRTQANAAAGPVGVLGQLRAPSMLGTWSVTFHDSTNITLIAPDNSTLDLIMPVEDAPLYEPVTKGVSALFGVQPNGDTRIGQSATLSRIKVIKGSKVIADDTFQASELNPSLWTVRAQDPGGIFTTTPDLAYLISWNLPDTGFSLRAGPTVTGPWSASAPPILVGARRVVLLNKSALPGQSAGFLQLIK
jgi:hypothetical protein